MSIFLCVCVLVAAGVNKVGLREGAGHPDAPAAGERGSQGGGEGGAASPGGAGRQLRPEEPGGGGQEPLQSPADRGAGPEDRE